MSRTTDCLVVGAGGFIGGHLVRSLLLQGLTVRAVDIRPVSDWTQRHPEADNRSVDVGSLPAALAVTSGATTVYDLVSGPPSANRADRMATVLLDTHLLLAARDTGVDRFVQASTATAVRPPLAAPGSGDRHWRDRFTERMTRHFVEQDRLQARVARLGPVYGPHAPWRDDAAVVTVVTRRIATAGLTHRVSVDIPYAPDDPAAGIYVDDAVLGLQLVTHGVDDHHPYDVVDPAPRTVADVVETVLVASGLDLDVVYTGRPGTGVVVGDPVPLRQTVDWEPDIALTSVVDGLYAWTTQDLRSQLDLPTDLAEHSARRRAANTSRTPVREVGRHRYQNAG